MMLASQTTAHATPEGGRGSNARKPIGFHGGQTVPRGCQLLSVSVLHPAVVFGRIRSQRGQAPMNGARKISLNQPLVVISTTEVLLLVLTPADLDQERP